MDYGINYLIFGIGELQIYDDSDYDLFDYGLSDYFDEWL